MVSGAVRFCELMRTERSGNDCLFEQRVTGYGTHGALTDYPCSDGVLRVRTKSDGPVHKYGVSEKFTKTHGTGGSLMH